MHRPAEAGQGEQGSTATGNTPVTGSPPEPAG